MEVINLSKNTIYIEDIELYIPYKDDLSTQTLSPDQLKKSKILRTFILNGTLDIAEFDDDQQVERSIVYMKKKVGFKPKRNEIEKHDRSDGPDDNYTVDGIEIKMRGLFLDASGYGKVNRNMAVHLAKLGYKLKIEPHRSQEQLDETELLKIADLQKTKLSKNHILIDSVIPTLGDTGSGIYKILSSTIESYSIPKQFLDCCHDYNEVWLTSEFSCGVLKEYLPDKIINCVPTGADHHLYTEDGPKLNFKPNIKNFVFVSVFGWNYRKGYDVLLKAYLDEFSDKDDVSLLLITRYQGNTHRASRDKIKNDIDVIMQNFPNKDLPHIVRYSNIIKEKDMPKLYRAANAFVLFSRGEGGGLPPVEASLCGLPVIMTNVSGQQMYLRDNNSYTIEMDELVEAQHGEFKIHYWDGQKFPSLKSPSVHKAARKVMREVFENYSEAKKRNKKLQKLILNNFTWEHAASIASKRLIEINKKLKGV